MRGEAEPRDRSLMYRHTWDLALVSSALFGLGCQNSDQPPGSVGPDLEVRVAALSLEGPDEVCYDLRVDNQSGIVWQRGNPLVTKLGADQTAAPGSASSAAPDTATICSSMFGNGPGGDITWVGTCDASSDSGAADGVQNDVTLWVDGLYKNGAELADWRDPCPTGCTIEVDCRANADNLARFDLTVMRDASQGFFDVAVNFEDIFCSAKVDTCDTNNQPLRLLFGDDQTRDPTGVAALACTSGVGGATLLQFSEVTVTCTGGDVFVLDLLGAAGNRESTSNTSARTLQYALYRGAEALTCDGPNCGKVYSNLAINLAQLASVGGTCTLAFSATATDGTGFAAGLPTATSFGYPYIDVDAVLTSAGAPTCIRHAVNDGAGVIETTYYGDLQGLDAPPPMCTRYDGAAASATGADCDEEAPQPLGLCAGIPLGDGQVEVHIASTGSGTACTDEAPCGYVQGHTRAHSLVGPYVVIHDDVGPQQFDVEPTQWTLSQGAVLCGREGADRPLMSHIGVTLAKGATVANLTVARNSGDSAAFGGSGDLEGVEIRQVTIRNAQRGIYFYNAEGTVVVDDLHLRADDPYQFQVGIESTLSKQTMTLLLSNLDFEEVLYTGLDVYPFAGANQKLRLSGLNRMVAALDFGGNGYLLQLVNLRGGQAGSRIDAEISGLAPVNAASGISLGQGDGVTTYAHIHDNDLRTLRGYGLTAIKSSSAGSFHVTAENNLLRATGFLESFEGETFESQANAMTFLATSAGAQLCAEVTDNTVEAVVEDGVVPFGLSAFGNAAAALRIVNRDTLSADNGGMSVNLSGTVAAGGPACELPVIP